MKDVQSGMLIDPTGHLGFLEHVFAYAAQGADPTFRKIIERCACRYVAIRIANRRVVFISANCAHIFLHVSTSSKMLIGAGFIWSQDSH
jgi:hypothetical protein